ncbi:class I SAM-dependent methyltransferase [Chloroflexi bacterium TSY]|nr:class I SAM-dependent methyltransferase [Chloroflexi bacterium TSY]
MPLLKLAEHYFYILSRFFRVDSFFRPFRFALCHSSLYQKVKIKGNMVGLLEEIERYLLWKLAPSTPSVIPTEAILPVQNQKEHSEAAFWDQADLELMRYVSWGSANNGILLDWAFSSMCRGQFDDLYQLLAQMLGGESNQRRGLVLGCGDMAWEYELFTQPKYPFATIDACDVSSHSLIRAQELTTKKGLDVNYFVADVNKLELPSDTYDLIVVYHAYHHFDEIDLIAKRINRALKPDGVFYTSDYVGPARIQWTNTQLYYARQFLRLLPERYRREVSGQIRTELEPVSLDAISSDEAIGSEQILPAIAKHMNVV